MSAPHDDFQTEPVRGLPEALPKGEVILWQGAPRWRALAWEAFGIRTVLGYFGILAAWRVIDGATGPDGLVAGLISAALLVPVAAAAIVLLCGMAWSAAKATVYTITNRRVAMRIGVALTLTLNLPFTCIGSAALRTRRGGTGDIPLALTGPQRMAFLAIWPHARPWHLNRAQPSLRCIPDAARVAGVLAEALRAHAATAPAQAAPVRTVRTTTGAQPQGWLVPAR